jgi:hypothetical protein
MARLISLAPSSIRITADDLHVFEVAALRTFV